MHAAVALAGVAPPRGLPKKRVPVSVRRSAPSSTPRSRTPSTTRRCPSRMSRSRTSSAACTTRSSTSALRGRQVGGRKARRIVVQGCMGPWRCSAAGGDRSGCGCGAPGRTCDTKGCGACCTARMPPPPPPPPLQGPLSLTDICCPHSPPPLAPQARYWCTARPASAAPPAW